MPRLTGFSRRNFLQFSPVAAAGALLAACAPTITSPPASTPEAPVANADEALQRLLEGNQRYAAHKSTDVHESASRRGEVAQSQKPFATIFSCVDSRVPPELVFDRGLGDLFVVRTAGQVIDHAVLGSLQYGVAELHIPLLMVLGHEKCGAVKATLETLESHTTAEAEINWLVEGLRPAVEKVKDQGGDVLDNAVKANIELTVNRLKTAPILSEAIAAGELKIVGGRYDLDTGLVEMIV